MSNSFVAKEGEIWFLQLLTMHPILVIPFQSGGGELVFTTHAPDPGQTLPKPNMGDK